MKTIRDVFYYHLADLKIDNAWVKDYKDFLTSIMVKNENTVSFFGSILVGVYPVFWETNGGDDNYLWDSLCQVDKDEVKSDLHRTEYINPSWNIGGNVTNHLFIFLMHKVFVSPHIKDKVKEATIIDLLVLLQFKFMTSLFYRDYEHGVDRELALTVYNKLSRRFILRQVDSWKEFFYLQARNIYLGSNKRNSIIPVLQKYNKDIDITRTITGISTNLNSTMKEYNAVFHSVKDESDRINLDSRLGVNSEGEVEFKDNLSNPIRYLLTLQSGITTDTFMDDQLIGVISRANFSRYRPLRKTLDYIHKTYGKPRQDHVTEFAELGLQFSLSKLSEYEQDLKDVRGVFNVLSGVLTSSRSLDDSLIRLKGLGDRVIKEAAGDKQHNNTITATRTTAIIYIVVWTLTRH